MIWYLCRSESVGITPQPVNHHLPIEMPFRWAEMEKIRRNSWMAHCHRRETWMNTVWYSFLTFLFFGSFKVARLLASYILKAVSWTFVMPQHLCRFTTPGYRTSTFRCFLQGAQGVELQSFPGKSDGFWIQGGWGFALMWTIFFTVYGAGSLLILLPQMST